MGTPCRAGRPSRTRAVKTIRSVNQIMSRPEILKAHSSLPKRLKITVEDCELLLFINLNSPIPYDEWPAEYRQSAAIERLKRRGHVRRKYWPLRYGVSRSGYTLVRWLTASLEHRSPNSSASAAGA